MTDKTDPEFSDDLLRGAAEIAEFLFGDRNFRRKVYHLARHSNMPFFKMGSMWCARKSELNQYFQKQITRRCGEQRNHAA